MFHRTFPLLNIAGYTHWFQYEPDVKPIRTGWLSQIVELSKANADCELWWQLGSEPTYNSVINFVKVGDVLDVDLHINGNALYCVSSPEFSTYRSAVRKAFPPMGCQGDSVIGEANGWDHALYRYRHSWAGNRDFRHHSKFRLDPLIRNLGNSPYTLEDIRNTYPDTFLVHGKNAVDLNNLNAVNKTKRKELSSPQNLMADKFWRVFGRQPSQNEHNFWNKLLVFLQDPNQLYEYMITFRAVCREKKVPPQITQLFDSSQHAAVSSAFVTTLGRLPYPQELKVLFEMMDLHGIQAQDYLEHSRKASVMPEAVGFTCDLAANMACKASSSGNSVISHHCRHDGLQHKLNSMLPVDCTIQHVSISKLETSCGGISSETKDPLGCVHFEKVNDELVCKKRYLWDFPSHTPHSRSLPLGNHHGSEDDVQSEVGFAVHFQKLYEATTFNHDSKYQLPKSFYQREEYFLTRKRRTLWVTDFHASPSMCNSEIFSFLNVNLNAKIDFGNCH